MFCSPDTSPEQPDTAIDKTTAVDDAQSLSLIDKILAKRDVADATRSALAEAGEEGTLCVLPRGPQTIPYVAAS